MSNKAAATKAKSTGQDSADQQELAKAPKSVSERKDDRFKPILVKAETMFDRLADLAKETTDRAYELFKLRGGEFGREFEDWFRAESEVMLPVRVEVSETNEVINVRAAVPGFKPDDIEVSVKDKTLILSGENESREKQDDENMILSEFRSNKFCRQLPLTSNVDGEGIEAILEDGVLQLTLPKLPEREATQVPVNAT